ncbi:hypothetical protein [Sneathiella glossodoripedis]|uniref:hypothetical protein n=1 Tax=Sneathiella glossodoripedis TaxID=418853 RepID=UPI00046FEF25|nr:hypothetical protein [Sneathiella glossodoripedis]
MKPTLKTLLLPLAAATLLTACTTTSTEVKRTTATNSPGQTTVQVASVRDIVDASRVGSEDSTNLPHLVVHAAGDEDKVTIKMGENFSRRYFQCNDTADCQEVRLVKPQPDTHATTGHDDQPEDNFMGKVELSDATKALFGRKLTADMSGKRILIMRPDVELYELGVALQEPNALWTSMASNYVTEISAQYFQKLGYDVAIYQDDSNEVSEKTGQDLIALHEDVGISIIQFQQSPLTQLPTLKSGKFDWHLGRTTQDLAKGYGADYSLFIYLRDQYSSGSRVAAQLLMSVIFGVHVQGGIQVGFASLVNLKTGEVEWFNRIISTTGDLRTFRAAVNATNALFEDIPL